MESGVEGVWCGAVMRQLTLAERIAIVSANSKGVKFGIFNDMTASCGWQACKIRRLSGHAK
ncbi:hypothetical protein E2C01_012046 [Portunus trituberculatus]|uniref:Uncharacterized protein n=1 Tax=Portunus trituberculatus TaxID=210409 RepID=A0A5B7DCX3_PORTR|nr:hypothetical protein [Portunus trituberculatus]